MKLAPIPADERARLAALDATGLFETPPEPDFDDIAQLAAALCGTPIALISLVGRERVHFKARVGLPAEQSPRELSLCAHAMYAEGAMVVQDTRRDERFHDHPFCIGEPHVAFYAGEPLYAREGEPLGTLCVIDHARRELTPAQLEALRILARQVMQQMELRRRARELASALAARDAAERETALAREHARRAERLAAIGTLTAGVAHEINNPLTYMRGSLELMDMELDRLRDAAPEERDAAVASLHEHVRRVLGGVERVTRITRSLRLVARPHLAAREELDLAELIEQVATAAWCRAPDGARLDLSLERACLVLADRDAIAQAALNLLLNAMDATREARSNGIAVRVRAEDGHALLEVEDHGAGIPPEVQPSLFTPFFTTKPDGTGLGLSVSFQIAEAHKGQLTVESTPGRTVFRLRLPLAPPKAAAGRLGPLAEAL